MICGNCGKEINDKSAVCPLCGSEVVRITSSGLEGASIASTNLEDGKIVVKKKMTSKTTILIIVVSALVVIGALLMVIIGLNNKINNGLDVSKIKEKITLNEIEKKQFDEVYDEEATAPDAYESQQVTEIVTDVIEKTTVIPVTDKEETTTVNGDSEKNDPSEWSKDEIVSFYKTACNKSTGVKSTQYMFMRDNTLTADGGNSEFLGYAEDVIIGVMEKNTIEFDGITGGYKDLKVSDCKQAKAYKEGKYTVVEMVMYDQVDDAYGNKYSGTVGHAISVVDGVAEVAEQFPLFDVQYENADIKISYTNAILKVKINSKGVIEKGTWSYVVTPSINNLYIEKLLLNNAGAVIDYKVTVGGGF